DQIEVGPVFQCSIAAGDGFGLYHGLNPTLIALSARLPPRHPRPTGRRKDERSKLPPPLPDAPAAPPGRLPAPDRVTPSATPHRAEALSSLARSAPHRSSSGRPPQACHRPAAAHHPCARSRAR